MSDSATPKVSEAIAVATGMMSIERETKETPLCDCLPLTFFSLLLVLILWGLPAAARGIDVSREIAVNNSLSFANLHPKSELFTQSTSFIWQRLRLSAPRWYPLCAKAVVSSYIAIGLDVYGNLELLQRAEMTHFCALVFVSTV